MVPSSFHPPWLSSLPAVAPPAPPQNSALCVAQARSRCGRSFHPRSGESPRFLLLTKQDRRRGSGLHRIIAGFCLQSEGQRLAENAHRLVEFLHREAAAVSRSISGESLDRVSFPPFNAMVASAFVGGMASCLVMSNSIFNKKERVEYPKYTGKNLGALEGEEEQEEEEEEEEEEDDDDEGEEEKEEDWLLIMNPTPFNRFVLMRCQSIELEEEEEDVYEEGIAKKLAVERRHFVKLRSPDILNPGRSHGDGSDDEDDDDDDDGQGGFVSRLASRIITNIHQNPKSSKSSGHIPKSGSYARRVLSQTSSGSSKQSRDLVDGVLSGYQRRYVQAEDGGVLAIDWPSHLDLLGDNGLDTTVLLIAGTAAGSRNKHIQSFVKRSVRCGYFPIVMNPRGCGGSPLITPRIFTAGDSSDVQIVVDFVSRSRPWTTIMAVGWGYGANMLAKYLGEVELATPVTAAVCINNPFDLEESTRASSDIRAIDLDRYMTNGFIQILKENQMVFEGRKNQFDARKGLSATTVREFDKAISMVSNGFGDIHAFYEYSSSRSWIDNIEVPLLCIQDDDTIGKSFSVPRHVFERNPYTTLILSLGKAWKPKQTIYQQEMSRIQHDSLIIEWLAAVELAFLKGRHPLLEGIDVTYKPPKEFGFLRKQLSSSKNQVLQMHIRRKHITEERSHGNVEKQLSDWDPDLSEEKKMQEIDHKDVHGISKDYQQLASDVRNTEEDPEMERGQLKRAAESVMNALDITMPGSLSEKKKEEVLEAVGKGETIISALQAACPENVREKMTAAVFAAVQSRGISLKNAGFGKNIPVPTISESTVKEIQQKLSSVQNKLTAPLTNKISEESLDIMSKETDDIAHGNRNGSNEHSEVSVKRSQSLGSQEDIHDIKDFTATGKTTFQNWDGSNNPEHFSQSSTDLEQAQFVNPSDVQENGNGALNGALSAQNESGHSQGEAQYEVPLSNSSDVQVNDHEIYRGGGTKQISQEGTMEINEIKETEIESEGKRQLLPKVDSEVNNRKPPVQTSAENSLPVAAQKSISTSIDARQAWLAFTEVDDSTQMAVTNVFEVIGNVIDQLEKEQEKNEQNQDDNEEAEKRERQNQDENHLSVSEESENLPQVASNGEGDKEQNSKNEYQKQNIQVPTLCNSQELMRATDDIACNENLHNDGFPLSLNKYYGTLPARKLTQREFIITGKQIGIPDDVALEYFEDEKIWKLISNSADSREDDEINDSTARKRRMESERYNKLKPDISNINNNILAEVIEPAYIIMDDEKHLFGNRSCAHKSQYDDENADSEEYIEEQRDENNTMKDTALKEKIKGAIVDAVHRDLLRRFGDSELKIFGDRLCEDIEMMGLAVAEATNPNVQSEESSENRVSQSEDTGKEPKMHVNRAMSAINNVYGDCVILPRFVPVGVLFGLVLTALNPLGILSTDDVKEDEHTNDEQITIEKTKAEGTLSSASRINNVQTNITACQDVQENRCIVQDQIIPNEQSLNTSSQVMNLTASAIDATATYATERIGNESSKEFESEDFMSIPSMNSTHTLETQTKNEDSKLESDGGKTSIVSALAEKAMFVASPVVPVKEDGELDHDRLVEVLAALVQKGGMWRYIGKMALLWGGLRGAINLTDKLLGFLHMSDRPLHHRLPGFVVMALLLWSPVFVPLLPTLLQQWANQSYNGIASMAALVGLYGAVVILVAIWGRKIRGYNDPLVEYGIKLQPTLRQLQALASGFVFGLSPILSIHFLSVFCGFTHFNWDPTICISGSQSWLSNVASSLRMLKVVLQCLGTSLAISFLKELIFRSWLQDEISVDLGFHKAAVLSGLAFAVCHWSIPAIPSLWLLSLVLSGVKVKCNGNLVLVIGIHAGLIAGNQFMNQAGKLKYAVDAPTWILGARLGDPLTGLVGVIVLCILALSLYPWDHRLQRTNGGSTSI